MNYHVRPFPGAQVQTLSHTKKPLDAFHMGGGGE